jgi:MFS family permease
MVGLAFVSSATVLPAFAESLGATTVYIGAIPAVMMVGWFLPPLFAAAHAERLPRKLPFVMRWTGWERLPFLVLTLVAFFLADGAPVLSLWLLLVMLLGMTTVGGFLMPAWTDLVARTLPARIRGRFFGLASLVGTAGGLAGTALTSWALGALAPSTAYGVCFLAATVFVGLSWIALALVREPPAASVAVETDFWTHLGGIPALLRQDTNFAWYLVARVLTFGAVVGAGFFTVYALRVLGAPAADVGVFTGLLLAGQMAGQVALGWAADRAGHRVVLVLAAGAATVMNLVALAAGSLGVFATVFALSGFFTAAIQVSAVNVLFEFSPTPRQNPTYVGIERTFLAPFAFGLPLLGGVLIDAISYGFVFALSAACSAASAVVLLVLVRDPRHRAAAATTAGVRLDATSR